MYGIRIESRGTFIDTVREIAEHAKTVRETGWNPLLARSVGRKFNGGMFTKPRTANSHVDDDVEDSPC